jgi:hypothetical protein
MKPVDKVLIYGILLILLYAVFQIWDIVRIKPNEYHSAGWSSMVLELPPNTRDWKEWKGKTYCLLNDNEWHECDPTPANSALRGDK